MKILLVDDDPDYREQMQIQLEAAGYKVDVAEGVADAKKYLESHRPDLALVDLMLEDMDGGFTLCYHIKKLDSTIPVLLVTAVASETGLSFDAATDEERSWVKADGLLAKPVRIEQLQREIKRLLNE